MCSSTQPALARSRADDHGQHPAVARDRQIRLVRHGRASVDQLADARRGVDGGRHHADRKVLIGVLKQRDPQAVAFGVFVDQITTRGFQL